jgi:hypothetical protein
MKQPALAKQELPPTAEKIKYRYFRYKAGKASNNGHNLSKGTHGKDPKACMACVTAVLASMEYEGKMYFGVSFRNDKDQVNRKLGRLIAFNRLMKNIGESWSIDADALRAAIRNTYESGPHFNIKYYWRELVKSIGCY